MDAEELKIQQPDLYAAVFGAGRAEGLAAGKAEGSTAERTRILAIEKLATLGPANLIAAAKADPSQTAETLALKILDHTGKAMNAYRTDALALGKQVDQVGVGAPVGPGGVEAGDQEQAKKLGEKMKQARR